MTTEKNDQTTTVEQHEEFLQAKQAADEEHEHTPRQAILLHPRAVLWSVLVSASIIMEGYDLVLIYSFFAQPAFARRYGECDASGDCQITAPWQSGLSNAVGCGTIIGAFANGYFCHKFGFRPVLLISLAFICAFISISFTAPNLPVLLVGQFLCGIPWVSSASTVVDNKLAKNLRVSLRLWRPPMLAKSVQWLCVDTWLSTSTFAGHLGS
jgi:SP family general alpha glucoside:H+ symporter-like MFS transporter